jgi:phosphoribosylformylglycinamidine synthase
MSVYEIYVERKTEYAEEAQNLAKDLSLVLKLEGITSVRIINRYFAEGVSKKDFLAAKNTIFSDPAVDVFYDSLPSFNDNTHVFAVEFLPGQFDQRAELCAQCIMLASVKEKPIIKTAKIYVICAKACDDEIKKIKSWLINPVECRETSLEKPQTLIQKYAKPSRIDTIEGFINLKEEDLKVFQKEMNLAMDLSDLRFCQNYFKNDEKRNPTITEIRVLDTYWSDHCRHTTFLTELEQIQIEDESIKNSYDNYLQLRKSLGRQDKPVTLMDMATIAARALKQKGLLDALDESEEINACSVKIKVDVNGENQDWLLMFKNETHNHPTEIEPFGGAATCLGGAIRDPLSGRAYVYQAMRVTGAGNPLSDISDTLPGKLPQRKICQTAAAGYSSYGNQIGLASGHVHEIYHPGFVAKRMELGALIGAAPASNVVRQTPQAGDLVILLGGKTGRDGIGGATGSSKSHTKSSLETCGADVQKGNALEERKIVRLFRNPEASRLIKKCNDFGAGGVSVSVGELADGLLINLDKVPKKYKGLNGTELAISESQERMSIVVSKKDVKTFIKLAKEENLEAVIIAKVTKQKRLVMKWNSKTIVNISRDFLNSNGEKKYSKVFISAPAVKQGDNKLSNINELENFTGSLNICSQRALLQRFDSSIGAATVVLPYGGKYQLTPSQVMAAKIPVPCGETKTCSLMSWGYDPEISSISPYHGSVFAVVYSMAKIIASGGSRKNTWLSFQEYFEKPGDDSVRWGKPAAALLGALDAQLGLEIAAIGGKDSMSGSFEKLDVPPTLVSFAVSTAKTGNIVTPEFKKSGSRVYLLKPPASVFEKCDFSALCEYFDRMEMLVAEKKILGAWAAGSGGIAEAVVKMCVGNRIGFISDTDLTKGCGFSGFVVETQDELNAHGSICIEYIGKTTSKYVLKTPSYEISLEKLQSVWEQTLEPVYPSKIKQEGKTKNLTLSSSGNLQKIKYSSYEKRAASAGKPRFFIPIFPGTNSEYDSIRAIEKAGGIAKTFVVRNLSVSDIKQSVKTFEKAIKNSNVVFFAGGISGADEPIGSAKFITALLCNPFISDALMDLLKNREGLIAGTGSGFHALLKSGLLPYGEIRKSAPSSVAITSNTIGRHQSIFVNIKIISNTSPWLSCFECGEQYIVPVSHAEGRFIADESLINELSCNFQIATQYVDFDGNASQDISFNPNNSDYSIEGITSACGRIFGQMAHNERLNDDLYKNIPGIKKMDIFSGAVKYFNV